jgi:hypothetical protein
MNEVIFKVRDGIVSDGKEGEVWKITDEAIHVRFENGMFQKFHFKPYHHKQSSISELKLINPNPIQP